MGRGYVSVGALAPCLNHNHCGYTRALEFKFELKHREVCQFEEGIVQTLGVLPEGLG